MNYDETLHNNGIDYGIVAGNNKIVFIKTGRGGNYLGDENKYLIMARRLFEKYGCSVIVSSNPHDGVNHNREDKQMIKEYMAANHACLSELFFFGHSNGGVKGLELANENIVFKKMILVNMPLMINFHKIKRYIFSIPQTQILAIYGEHDPSFPYMPLLNGRAEHVKAITFPGADHTFQGLRKEFIAFSDWLMN